MISSEGSASEHQANRLGEYKLTGVLADRPIYKNEERDEFLFYLRVSRFKSISYKKKWFMETKVFIVTNTYTFYKNKNISTLTKNNCRAKTKAFGWSVQKLASSTVDLLTGDLGNVFWIKFIIQFSSVDHYKRNGGE